MNDFDVVIVGCGMVGLSAACALSQSSMKIAMIDANPALYKTLNEDDVMIRASAINLSSQQFLTEMGVWNDINATNRALSFNSIDVFEKEGIAKLDANNLKQKDHLGHIIENQNIQNCLFNFASNQQNITFINSAVTNTFNTSDRVFITLDNGDKLSAKLIIAADGAQSKMREMANLKVWQNPYRHYAVMATVKTEKPHRACARQIFYADGIIAFLPLWKPNLSCLVWSVKPEEATRLQAEDTNIINQELTQKTEFMLGQCEIISDKMVFPLTARFCTKPVQERMILIGDAAHTIHPLAGQGVNLGFKDARHLANVVKELFNQSHDIGLKKHYHTYQLIRHKDTLAMMAAMQVIQDTFDGGSFIKQMIRGVGMNIINHVPLIKNKVISFGLGL